MAFCMRIFVGSARRCVWIEWSAAGYLWQYAPLAGQTFQGNPTGLLFPCRRTRNDRLWYKDLFTWEVIRYFLICLPVVIPAIFIGRYFNHRLKDDAFLKYVYVGLICIGIVLLVRGVG